MADSILPDLRRAMKSLAHDEILVPSINTALFNPSFKSFDIHVEGFAPRPFDGYFHPSTHSMWNVRQLALYLMKPQMTESERMKPESVFAITQGHFWHMFLQHLLKEIGFLVEDEVGFKDEEHRRTGHMDGLLKIGRKRSGLEVKTINSFKIAKMTSETALRELKPEYYAQAQEYLDVFDLPEMRFLFIAPTYPFTMKEFVVVANVEHQLRRREIYKGAIQIAESGQFPLPPGGCCGQKDTCPVRYSCRMTDG